MLGHSQHRSCDTSHDVTAAYLIERTPGVTGRNGPAGTSTPLYGCGSTDVLTPSTDDAARRAGLIEASNVNVTRQRSEFKEDGLSIAIGRNVALRFAPPPAATAHGISMRHE